MGFSQLPVASLSHPTTRFIRQAAAPGCHPTPGRKFKRKNKIDKTGFQTIHSK